MRLYFMSQDRIPQNTPAPKGVDACAATDPRIVEFVKYLARIAAQRDYNSWVLEKTHGGNDHE
jgi:hypothetical protein